MPHATRRRKCARLLVAQTDSYVGRAGSVLSLPARSSTTAPWGRAQAVAPWLGRVNHLEVTDECEVERARFGHAVNDVEAIGVRMPGSVPDENEMAHERAPLVEVRRDEVPVHRLAPDPDLSPSLNARTGEHPW